MLILGIETSCDETAAAVVRDGREILSNVVVSQIDIFAEYGGVIPEVAARSHLEAMMPVVDKALADAGVSWDEIDAIGVTYAPGLLGSLLVGTLTARTLAILHGKPLYAVHHLKSHVYANWVRGDGADLCFSGHGVAPARRHGRSAPSTSVVTSGDPLEAQISPSPAFPLLALVVSGGHTQILYMPAHNRFEIVGTTRDDAVGECFDKVAKILGLPYPGGPAIATAAKKAQNSGKYRLPHPKISGLDFSFSGLKTAVLRAVQKEVGVPISYPSYKLAELLTPRQVADFAASFQNTVVDILLEKVAAALKIYPDVKSVVVAGGVSANQKLRERALEMFQSGHRHEHAKPTTSIDAFLDVHVYFPAPTLSGDNGAMVAAACYYEIMSGVKPTDPYKLNIYPRVDIN